MWVPRIGTACRAALLFLLLGGTLGAAGGEAPAAPSAIERERLLADWKALLDAATLHTAEARERIAAAQADERAPLRSLAKLLLEDWNRDPSDEKWIRPVNLVPPAKPDLGSLPAADSRVKSPLWLKGRIGEDGQVKNLELRSSSGNEKIDRMALESIEQALFRPGYGPAGFQESSYEWSVCLHPQ